MNALHKLQQAFAADLWRDDMHHMQGVILDDKLSAARRFSVYRNNFQSSLTDALAAIYPVVQQLVGREFFAFMADRFIRTHPSRSGNLHSLGDAMPGFLRHFNAVSHLPYLADIAQLDFACHSVFHASAPTLFDTRTLDQVAAENYSNLRFCLGPACRLVSSAYPIFRIWKVNQESYEGANDVHLDDGPESLLVVRPELDVELWQLNPADAELLRSLASGKNLGESVEVSLSCSRDFDLQAVLGKCLAAGALVAAANDDDH